MIRLQSERMRLGISPEAGASITFCETLIGDAWRPVLQRPAAPPGTPAALASPLFVMVPFANRARDNKLNAAGVTVPLKPNTADPLALHGTGWERPWQVTATDPTACTLALSVREGYPFRFDASLSVVLEDAAVTLRAHITNAETTTIPAGLGFHPYFPRGPDTLLRFRAGSFWLEGPDHLPTDAITVPPELDFSDPQPVPGAWRNNCYSGWDGEAEIIQPSLGYGVSITAAAPLRELMLYVPDETSPFALEPQSHTSGATNGGPPSRGRTLSALAPGEVLETAFTMSVASTG